MKTKLVHQVNTKGTLYFEGDDNWKWAQRHTLIEVDVEDDVPIEIIDEFYLSDYEDGHIIDATDHVDYEWNGYSEDWSDIESETNSIDAMIKWNKYKNKFK